MTCKDCIHYEACHDMYYEEHATRHFDPEKHNAEKECGYFKDRSRFVELPCKVGDTVFVVEEIAEERKIIKDHVETISIGYYADGVNIYQFDGIKTDGYFEDFGKTVFLTREEAEQALKLKTGDTNA